MPWSDIKVRLVLVEVNHIRKGEVTVKKFMNDNGFLFLLKIGVDLVFYNPLLSSDMELSLDKIKPIP